ncbi:MAG: chemotaxis response regulator protein-glutamate methylesterase [Saccharospirillaceae bacterium]|nr:chemotaxis response regulator protein-glutamate methylesterase [Pseudomonadales bacterium]NRB80841.1 chemotaxis response regulator protein-glutamate methylesterase [Saccharospirillaceae bacterium]
MKKIKVLIVDDSALIRSVLKEILNSSDLIEVVGTANDPIIARDKIKQLQPDVLTLDIEMPKMDGITFLKNLMRLRPMPVVMISTLTQKGATVTFDSLAIGAVDFIAKPRLDQEHAIEEIKQEIIDKVITASKANLHSFKPKELKPTKPIKTVAAIKGVSDKIICIGASTGGTEAIKEVLMNLPPQMPPIIITQHIPAAFSASFADRLDRNCQLNVLEAEDGMKVSPGFVYLAPGGVHMTIHGNPHNCFIKLHDSEKVNRHRPAVEVMFDSVYEVFRNKAVAIMLTGMGADGAKAQKRLHDKGVFSIIQDENTSVVWGMPGSVHELAAFDQMLALDQIAPFLLMKLSSI